MLTGFMHPITEPSSDNILFLNDNPAEMYWRSDELPEHGEAEKSKYGIHDPMTMIPAALILWLAHRRISIRDIDIYHFKPRLFLITDDPLSSPYGEETITGLRHFSKPERRSGYPAKYSLLIFVMNSRKTADAEAQLWMSEPTDDRPFKTVIE